MIEIKEYKDAENMTGTEYQELAMRTNDGKSTERMQGAIRFTEGINGSSIDISGIINAALGLSGEVGELNDMIKKWVFHESEMDFSHAQKEIGDILWYVAMACQSFGFDMNKIMLMNVEKLYARYPEGFDTYRANHRKSGDV